MLFRAPPPAPGLAFRLHCLALESAFLSSVFSAFRFPGVESGVGGPTALFRFTLSLALPAQAAGLSVYKAFSRTVWISRVWLWDSLH